MAAAAGIEVHVVDPRAAFATEDRFPGVRLVHAWPAKGLAEIRPDHRTALVTLTHDAKLDDPALVAALDSPAFYVGALGSRRTHAKRLARLREEGVGEEGIARIRAPVGLDIGARTPAEIAVGILAQLIGAEWPRSGHGNRFSPFRGQRRDERSRPAVPGDRWVADAGWLTLD